MRTGGISLTLYPMEFHITVMHEDKIIDTIRIEDFVNRIITVPEKFSDRDWKHQKKF